jgi:hypothetical protein
MLRLLKTHRRSCLESCRKYPRSRVRGHQLLERPQFGSYEGQRGAEETGIELTLQSQSPIGSLWGVLFPSYRLLFASG